MVGWRGAPCCSATRVASSFPPPDGRRRFADDNDMGSALPGDPTRERHRHGSGYPRRRLLWTGRPADVSCRFERGRTRACEPSFPGEANGFRHVRVDQFARTIGMPDSTDNGGKPNFQRQSECGACGRGAIAGQSDYRHMLPGRASRACGGSLCRHSKGLLRSERRFRGRQGRQLPAGDGARPEGLRLALKAVLTARTARNSAETGPAEHRGLTTVSSWRHGQ